jgi:hypothetical protein
MAVNFGLTMPAQSSPLLPRESASTSKRNASARTPTTVRSHGVQRTLASAKTPALLSVTSSSRTVLNRSRSSVLYKPMPSMKSVRVWRPSVSSASRPKKLRPPQVREVSLP